MSTRHHKQRKRKQNSSMDDLIEQPEKTEQLEEDNGVVNLDQLIVRDEQPSYEPKYIDMNQTNSKNNKQERFTPNENQGSLFRNCAMAIAGKTTVEPLQPIQETFTEQPRQQSTPCPQQQPMEPETPPVPQPMPAIQQPASMEDIPFEQIREQQHGIQKCIPPPMMKNEMNFDYGYRYPVDHEVENMIDVDPLRTRRRPFNKRAFRITYIVIVIATILAFVLALVISKIRKHKAEKDKEKENTQHIVDTSAPTIPEKQIVINPMPTPVINTTNQQLTPPQIQTFDNNHLAFDTAMMGGNENDKLINDIEQIKNMRQRDNKGRFVKSTESIL